LIVSNVRNWQETFKTFDQGRKTHHMAHAV
jgi:hypothetical protein